MSLHRPRPLLDDVLGCVRNRIEETRGLAAPVLVGVLRGLRLDEARRGRWDATRGSATGSALVAISGCWAAIISPCHRPCNLSSASKLQAVFLLQISFTMQRARSLRSLVTTSRRPMSPGPPSPTFSEATNASALNFGPDGPDKIITRANLKASLQAYEDVSQKYPVHPSDIWSYQDSRQINPSCWIPARTIGRRC